MEKSNLFKVDIQVRFLATRFSLLQQQKNVLFKHQKHTVGSIAQLVRAPDC